jgi:hypothetical protein
MSAAEDSAVRGFASVFALEPTGKALADLALDITAG